MSRRQGGHMKLRTDSLTWQEIDGELVVLDLAGSVYLTANGSGTFLTKLLTEDRTERELASALAEEYDLPESIAAQDTREFIAQLRKKNLLITD
ncbi:PqqD family protein [Microbacterium horticulturae]|uniref:PqqD family protein n=1 Tax=Microbacterium horticulturae TaxID=3028316 RepID=A0ABY8BYA9_9MICO|nr:PqqD family protein [Microbacterium sp. KACC 23027]WEG09189.1 PqqD family protein [Microbacterium sp. KACC 23027]